MEQNKTAKHWTKISDTFVKCNLCPHECSIKSSETGICRARKNIDGALYTLNYGYISSIALDPIEKKPLYNFYPGSYILSVGTYGCNFKCSFCQNYSIAHDNPSLYAVTSEQLIDEALSSANCIGIAFTYNEPSIWYEFVYDTCIRSKQKLLKNVLVTNGYINEDPLKEILPYVDAMNIDVKAFSEKYYKEICKGSLEHVKKTVEIATKSCHVEITTLIVPGLNDSETEIEKLCKWLYSIDENIPLHITRYFPNYKMDLPPTPKETLYRLNEVAKMYLKYVYLGNI